MSGDVSTTDLLRVRAALAVGMPPTEALRTAADAELSRTARLVGLGRSLTDVARATTGASALGAGPLLRALALAERSGHGAVDAVDLALRTRLDAVIDEQRIRARSAQALGTARMLTLLPVVAWTLLLVVDPSAVRFYATAFGWVSAAIMATFGVTAHAWSRRLIGRASRAGLRADPLVAAPTAFDRGRALVAAAPVLLAGSLVAHPVVGVAAAGAVGAWAGRPPPAPEPPSCSTRELVGLLRMLLGAGTPLPVALGLLADVTATPVAAQLRGIGQRLRAGTDVERSFAGTGLAEVGAVLAITERWGVAAGPSLRLLGDALRARQRSAAETAAEQVQLALVFPTTLLTLPAFVVAVVPPLVWTAATA